MNARRRVKIAVDAAMFGLMLCLMSYPMTRGLLRHGVCGVSFLALLLVHQALNLDWYRALFRGRWNARRVLLTAANAALLMSSAALIASSLAMAGEVFPFAPFPMAWWGRGLHTAATAWSFVLVSFHLGLHGQSFWNQIRRARRCAGAVVCGRPRLYGKWAVERHVAVGRAESTPGKPPGIPGTMSGGYAVFLSVGATASEK